MIIRFANPHTQFTFKTIKKKVSEEVNWDNRKIIETNWYKYFIMELFQYFSIYGKERLNLKCNLKFYAFFVRFIPYEMIPELEKGLGLLTKIEFTNIKDTDNFYGDKLSIDMKIVWALICTLYKKAFN